MKLALGAFALLAMIGCGSDPSGTGAPSSSSPSSGDDAKTSASAPPTATGATTPATPAKLGAPYPVVFMHGMGGFGQLQAGPVAITYFDGVATDLTKKGEQVFVTIVPAYDTSEERAKALSKQIDDILQRTGKAKVNLVGHSQGGLDARVIASPAGLGYGDRVASVTTIATPHRGSKVADLALGSLSWIPDSVIDSVTADFLNILQKSVYDLTADSHLRAQVTELSEAYMHDVFNPKYVDDPRVSYASYAGRTNLRTGIGVCDGAKFDNDPLKLDAAQPLVLGTAVFLEEGQFKVNDGLVTVESAKWGDFLQCVPADHLKEVGQLSVAAASFDHLAFFETLVQRIRSAGF